MHVPTSVNLFWIPGNENCGKAPQSIVFIRLTSWLSFVVSTVSLSLSNWYPGTGVVLDCIDSWSLHPYLLWVPLTFSCLLYWKTTSPGVNISPKLLLVVPFFSVCRMCHTRVYLLEFKKGKRVLVKGEHTNRLKWVKYGHFDNAPCRTPVP